MGIAAGIMAVGSVVGSGISAFGQSSAANKQAQAQQQALALQQQMFATAQNEVQPFVNAGQSALPTLSKLLTPGADQSATLNQTPGFQFAQNWGLKGLLNTGTTRGLGGNVGVASGQFSEGLASNTYGQIVQQLLQMSGQGSSAASSLAGMAVQSGQNQAGTLTNMGNAQAAGIAGPANTIGTSLTGAANTAALTSILQNLKGSSGQYGATT